MPLEVKEWFCSLARVKPNWTMTQCLRFAKRALPSFFEHGGCRRRLPVPLLAARAPGNPQLSWPLQTSCPASAAECSVDLEC